MIDGVRGENNVQSNRNLRVYFGHKWIYIVCIVLPFTRHILYRHFVTHLTTHISFSGLFSNISSIKNVSPVEVDPRSTNTHQHSMDEFKFDQFHFIFAVASLSSWCYRFHSFPLHPLLFSITIFHRLLTCFSCRLFFFIKKNNKVFGLG